jgi:hypothetical protein
MNRIVAVLALWGSLAVVPAVLGVPPLAVPIALVSLVTAGVLAYRVPAVRAQVDAIDTRALILMHAVRAPIGAAFLILYAQDRLPAAFAVRGGIGDILAGLAALFVWSASRRARLAWNALGLLDLAMVVVTAQKLAFVDRDPLMRGAFAYFPFPLLPLFVVPLMVLSHLALFSRLRSTITSPRPRRSATPCAPPEGARCPSRPQP